MFEKSWLGIERERGENSPSCKMAPRSQNTDRHTPMLLPPDLRDGVAEDALVHFVIQAVERLPLSIFAVNPKGCGDAQYPPPLMLALLI